MYTFNVHHCIAIRQTLATLQKKCITCCIHFLSLHTAFYIQCKKKKDMPAHKTRMKAKVTSEWGPMAKIGICCQCYPSA